MATAARSLAELSAGHSPEVELELAFQRLQDLRDSLVAPNVSTALGSWDIEALEVALRVLYREIKRLTPPIVSSAWIQALRDDQAGPDAPLGAGDSVEAYRG